MMGQREGGGAGDHRGGILPNQRRRDLGVGGREAKKVGGEEMEKAVDR